MQCRIVLPFHLMQTSLKNNIQFLQTTSFNITAFIPFLEECRENMTLQRDSKKQCPVRCDSDIYRTALSYATFPSPEYLKYAEEYFNLTKDYTMLVTCYIRIKVYSHRTRQRQRTGVRV